MSYRRLAGSLHELALSHDGVSGVVETSLVNFVNQKVDDRDGRAWALALAAQSWNDFVELHGSFADKNSTL